MNSKCKTIAVVNQKGGVGKTTTTYNLGWELGRIGKNVLLVDFDSQGNLTMQAGQFNPDRLDKTIANVMAEFIDNYEIKSNTEDLIIHKEYVDVLPANVELAGLELSLNQVTSRETVLADVLEKFKNDYDYILIDCSPSLGLLPVNALAAADTVIIPVAAQFWAVKGMETLLKSISMIKRRINRNLRIEGILLTMYNPTYKITRDMQEAVELHFGEAVNVFDVKIPESIKMRESGPLALSARELQEIRKDSKPLLGIVTAYENLAKEIAGKECE